MDENDELTPLHPDHVKVLRISAALQILPIIVAAVVAEVAAPLPTGIIIGPVVIAAIAYLWASPRRRYLHKGYRMTSDRLRVVRGWWNRRDTVVPFGRVQHIDVNAGAIERIYGLGTLVLHTAGTHNASVSLTGLKHGDALRMREEIRAFIADREIR